MLEMQVPSMPLIVTSRVWQSILSFMPACCLHGEDSNLHGKDSSLPVHGGTKLLSGCVIYVAVAQNLIDFIRKHWSLS